MQTADGVGVPAGNDAWPGVLADGWRLALGTLTVVRVGAPARVDRRRAGVAMALAPIAVAPLGLGVGAIVLVGLGVGLPAVLVGLLSVGVLALGSRGLHLDGLADTADGLAASFDRERSLQVMKSGTCGPAGVVTLVLVLGLQAFSIAGMVGAGGARPVAQAGLIAVVVLISRVALATCCVRGIPAARSDGLGVSFAGSVPRSVAAGWWLVSAAVLSVAAELVGISGWYGVVAAASALVSVLLVIARTRGRFGGVTGDVFGAAVEVAMTTIVVVLAAGAAS